MARGIRVRLQAAGLTQRQLAAALLISPSGVTDRMLGRVVWRVTELARVAQVLGCGLDDLTAGDITSLPSDSTSAEQPPAPSTV